MKILVVMISFVLCILNSTSSQGQININYLQGEIRSPEGKPVSSATIMLMSGPASNVLSFSISKPDGSFRLSPGIIPDSVFLLKIEHIEYESWSKIIHTHEFVKGELHLRLQLTRRNQTLKEITVKAPPLPFKTQNDTTEFRAKAYRTMDTRRVEDLLKKMQGFQVSDDGRIYFQGKEIERVLLDGEDMTDRNYRLLSRNLNASLVDRVQVIDNYSSDRLMRSVERSGKIAINLTVDSAFQNRISGTVSVSSAGRKQSIDLSTVFPGKSLKWLNFTNFNQVGLQTGTQLSDDRTGESYLSESRKSTNRSPVFEPTQIPSPPLDVRYARDNEDKSAMQVFSRRDKKGQTFRLLTGVGQGRMHRSSDTESRLFALSGIDWMLQQQRYYSEKVGEAVASFHYKHDHRSNQTGDFGLHLIRTANRQAYTEQTSGEFIDSLSENHQQQQWLMRSNGQETFATKFGTIFKLRYGMDLERIYQNKELSTKRMIPLFSNVNGFDDFHQHIEMRKASGHADIAIHGRVGEIRWTGGINLQLQTEYHVLASDTDSGAAGRINLIPNRTRMIRTRPAVLYGSWQTILQRKTALHFSGALGLAPFDFLDTLRIEMADRHIYRLNGGIEHKFSMLSAIRFNAYRSRQLPSLEWFHAGPFLMADGQIRFPATELVPETSTGANLSISRVNLPRSFTGLLYFSYVVSDGVYRQVADRKPSFSRTTYTPFDGQRSLFASGSLSKHFPTLRFKWMTDASIQQIDGDSRLDQFPIKNQFGRFSIQQRFISAFSMPVNIEISYTASRNFNRLSSSLNGVTNIAQWQYVGYARLNGRFGDKGYISMIYGQRILMASSLLHTLDVYGRWKVSKSLFLSVTGHNLTNTRVIAQRMISLNATTDQRTSLVGRYMLVGAEWSF